MLEQNLCSLNFSSGMFNDDVRGQNQKANTNLIIQMLNTITGSLFFIVPWTERVGLAY